MGLVSATPQSLIEEHRRRTADDQFAPRTTAPCATSFLNSNVSAGTLFLDSRPVSSRKLVWHRSLSVVRTCHGATSRNLRSCASSLAPPGPPVPGGHRRLPSRRQILAADHNDYRHCRGMEQHPLSHCDCAISAQLWIWLSIAHVSGPCASVTILFLLCFFCYQCGVPTHDIARI